MTRRLRHRRHAALVIATLALVPGVVGCGLPLDDEPRAVIVSTTAAAPGEDQSTNEAGNSTAYLFFIADNQLIALEQETPSSAPTDALTALFSGVPSNANEDVVSQIPTGTRLLGTKQDGTQLNVDVSKEFDNLVGTGRSQATAQIVMTATDLEGIDQVALSIEGQPTQVFSQARGDTDQVGACDYVGLLPSEEILAQWPLDRRSRQHLTTRRNRLLDQCLQTPSSGN